MPAKKSKSSKSRGAKNSGRNAPKKSPKSSGKARPAPGKKTVKAGSSSSKRKPVFVKKSAKAKPRATAKPPAKGKKTVSNVKKPSKPTKPKKPVVASKAAPLKPSKPAAVKKEATAAPAKAVPAANAKAAGGSKKPSGPAARGVVPLSKPLTFAPMKPTPRRVAEEVGATIEVAKGPVKMTPFLKKQKQRLIELRDAILNSIEGVSQESLRQRAEGSEASAFGMHQADAGSDAYDRDFALSLLSQEQDALYEINEALKRIENGTYGICEMSGKRIPEVRLEALPFTRYTVECQSRIEQEQMGGRWRRPVRSLFGLDEAAEAAEEGGEEEEGSTSTRSSNAASESLDFAKE